MIYKYNFVSSDKLIFEDLWKHVHLIGKAEKILENDKSLLVLHPVFSKFYLLAHVNYIEKFLIRPEIYQDKNLVFLRNAYDLLREPLKEYKLLLRFSCGNITYKLDTILFDKWDEVKDLSADNYRNAFEIINIVFRSRVPDSSLGPSFMNELINLDAYTEGPIGENYGNTDVSTTILRSFFYPFRFIENLPQNRDYTPINLVFKNFELKTQGSKVYLDDLLAFHFDEVKIILDEIKIQLDALKICYGRGGILYELTGIKKFDSEGVQCITSTKHIFTVYKLRFIALCILTYKYRLKYGQQTIDKNI